MKRIWAKLQNLVQANPDSSQRELARAIEMPSSTFNDQMHAQQVRNKFAESAFWESEVGQNFLLRLVTSTLYTFGIKAGVGAGRIEEFLEHIRLFTHVGISQSSLLRLVRKIELSILKYKDLQEQDLEQANIYGKQLEVVLGLDETWVDEMLLVCQDLNSGYLFLNKPQQNEIQTVGGPI